MKIGNAIKRRSLGHVWRSNEEPFSKWVNDAVLVRLFVDWMVIPPTPYLLIILER